jgi:DtxR family Mn-dependent transcriptional regulator
MVKLPLSEALEEFCEAVWMARERGVDEVGLLDRFHADRAVPQEIQVQAVNEGLVQFEAGRVRFTQEGLEVARAVIRRHRLADVLLFFALGMTSHEDRERITCQVEHTLQPELVDGICTLLGHPTHCPDGQPIPPGPCCEADSKNAQSVLHKLTWCEKGQRVQVKYIQPRRPDRLQRLIAFGVVPGAILTVEQTRPVFTIRLERSLLALEQDVAEDIYVMPAAEPTTAPQEEAPPPRRSRFHWLRGFGRRARIDHRK